MLREALEPALLPFRELALLIEFSLPAFFLYTEHEANCETTRPSELMEVLLPFSDLVNCFFSIFLLLTMDEQIARAPPVPKRTKLSPISGPMAYKFL